MIPSNVQTTMAIFFILGISSFMLGLSLSIRKSLHAVEKQQKLIMKKLHIEELQGK